ncbi:MAG: SDR family NAD(P)-dependent oxidoreductase [Myxococcota bacterium]
MAGASEGLGAAFARALAARGHPLVLIARRAEPLEKLAAELRAAHGVQVVCHAADLASADPRELLAEKVVGVLVYNAAAAPLGPFESQSLASAEQSIDVNCRAPVRFLNAVIPPMVKRRRGALILLSSLTAFQGAPFISVYGATKAFNLSLAEGLWAELRPHGVDVLAVCAGATLTPNYLSASARGAAPGELEPEQVVAEALARLGRGPMMIPGAFNRLASRLLALIPLRTRIGVMASQTRKLMSR